MLHPVEYLLHPVCALFSQGVNVLHHAFFTRDGNVLQLVERRLEFFKLTQRGSIVDICLYARYLLRMRVDLCVNRVQSLIHLTEPILHRLPVLTDPLLVSLHHVDVSLLHE